MQKLKGLLFDGLKMEEDFITLYLKVIKDEGFLQYFPDQNKAKQLLQTLINESKWHKKTLEEIINTF
jgi:rubrerythrin